MKPLYAVQFKIKDKLDPNSVILDSKIKDSVSSWVKNWYLKRKVFNLNFSLVNDKVSPIENHNIEVETNQTKSGEIIWSFIWKYPSDTDDYSFWQIHILLVKIKDSVDLSIDIKMQSKGFIVAPWDYRLRRPQIVKTIVNTFSCTLDDKELIPSPVSLGLEDLDDFEKEVFNPLRRLPMVLFSRDFKSQEYLDSPVSAADSLVGMAYVYCLENKWTSLALYQKLNKKMACYNGAVRLIWPGSRPENLKSNVYIPEFIKTKLSNYRNFNEFLFDKLSSIISARFVEFPALKKIKEILDSEEVQRDSDLRETIKAGLYEKKQLEDELLKLLEDYSKLKKEKTSLEDEVLNKDQKISELEQENFQHKENIKVLSIERPKESKTETDETDQVHDQSDCKSITEALERAGIEFSDSIDIWPSANESAEKSQFTDPDEVYLALMAISEVSKEYFESLATKRKMGPWEEIFIEKGNFKYKAKEHQTTLTMYEQDRTFTHEGEKRLMTKHLTLGGGSSTNCLQIYFDISEKKKRFLIAYCGKHLPYYSQRS